MLLQREREHFDLRLKYDRMAVWLSLGQALPEVFLDWKGTRQQLWDRVRKTLISRLRLQRVLVLELTAGEMRPLAPAGAAMALPAEVRSLLDASPAGFCNDPDADSDKPSQSLAQVLNLHRFMWSRIGQGNDSGVLVAAGFDRTKASFQSPLADSDAALFRNAAQHVESLLANTLLVAELARANESLEQRVRERTQELNDKNRELRLVLDNIDQALVTIDLEGRLVLERSSVVERWFGAHSGDARFLDYVPADQRFTSFFQLGLEALRDDVLPREVCLDQMPRQLVVRGRHFACRYLPIEEGNKLMALLLVIDDVTERRERARADAEQRELLAAFTELTRDRNGFLSFVEQTGPMLEQLSDAACAPLSQKHLLHTLKGNAGTLGLQVIADACHEAEAELVELGQVRPESLTQLRARWSAVLRTVRSVAPSSLHRTIEVSEQQLSSFIEQARLGASATQLVDELRLLQWEPVERSLERLAQSAQALATRLGKPPLSIAVNADEFRLDPTAWADLWAVLVHVLRNAIDHGIEPAEERAALGKPTSGRLHFFARRAEGGYQLEIADDGRGVDWTEVRRVCAEQGRQGQSQADLVAALLAPGFSTRREVTETSGRGIGLSAVAVAVRDLGGTLELESEQGRGTRFTLSFRSMLPR